MFQFFKKATSFLGSKLRSFFSKPWSADSIHELEALLYEADLGSAVAERLSSLVQKNITSQESVESSKIISLLKEEILSILQGGVVEKPTSITPEVWLIVGVNGSGKTTTVAKLATHLKKEGKTPLVIAADTFRAAATEQIELLCKQQKIDLVKGVLGGDPAAVVFDGLTSALAKGASSVLIDTAGRLQNKTALMGELEKIQRVSKKVVEKAPHQVLLILDATLGQNGVEQAIAFHEMLQVTGLILTKVDSSAKGGAIVAITEKLKLPVHWIGTGESMNDLQKFDAKEFVETLF